MKKEVVMEEEEEETMKTRRKVKENERLKKEQKEITKWHPYVDVYIMILLKPALDKVN
jgi:hypothetical protein